MSGQVEIRLDFDKTIIDDDVIESLSDKLKEDLERDSLKITLKESLALVQKGNKLQNGPANDLLICILRAMSLSNTNTEEVGRENKDVETQAGAQGLGTDPTFSQILRDQGEQDRNKKSKGPGDAITKQTSHLEKAKSKKELCRYYARGKCTRQKDCRFSHPSICKKFRQFGSVSTNKKGCDGKCAAFHPNACRTSLRNLTCSFPECRFFHLKGTKRANNLTNSRDSSNNNNRGNCNPNTGTNIESKNRFASLENPNTGQDSHQPDPEKVLLNQALEAILKRLTDMEARQAMYQPPLNIQEHNAVQPNRVQYNPIANLHNPVVPQLSTQTQRQWESQNQWSQSQY